MIFSSLLFLFVYMPIVLLGYLVCSQKLANSWLLFVSLLFYYIDAKEYLLLLIYIITIAFFPQLISGSIVRFREIREYLKPKYRKFILGNFVNGI